MSELGTPSISDALDGHGVAGVLDGLRCISAERACRIGTARVAEVVDSTANAIEGLGELLDSVQEGDYVVLAWRTQAIASTLGGLAATRLRLRGAAGLITEGYVRDVGEIEDSTLVVWARGATPRTGKGRVAIRLRDEITLANGVVVHAGDSIAADQTGVVVIPLRLAAEVLEVATENERKDGAVAAGLEEGGSFSQLMSDVGI